MHRYVEVTLGHVENTTEFLVYKPILFMHRYVEGTLGNVEKTLDS